MGGGVIIRKRFENLNCNGLREEGSHKIDESNFSHGYIVGHSF